MNKELYIAEVERIAAELEERGVPPDLAYDQASDLAYPAMQERLADLADILKKRDRGE